MIAATTTPAAYTLWAELLDYPQPSLVPRLRALAGDGGGPEELAGLSPVVVELVRAFAHAAGALSLGALEELYTQTFDLQPQCTLNLGHQLFGEDWKRSTLLIELKGLFDRHGLATGSELPDHLCWLLRLLAAVPEDAEVRELASSCLRPAVRALQQKLAESNPYTGLLQSLYLLLADADTDADTEDAPEASARPPW